MNSSDTATPKRPQDFIISGNAQASDSVILGELVEGIDPDCVNGFCADPIQIIKVEKVVFSAHNSKTQANDIMVIKLKKPANLNG